MTGETQVPASGRGRQGFGLIEVVVALMLLSIGVLSLSNVLTQSLSMETLTAQRTSALSIARTTMEVIRAMEPATIAAEAATAVNEAGDPDVNGLFTREVTVTDVTGNLIEVTVIVTAPRSSPISLVTLIYDGGT